MSDEPVRTRVRARGGWRALPGVHDPRARRPGRSRASSFDGAADAAPTPEVLDAIAAARRDRDRPVEPGHLDRADPRRARDARGARATRRRRSSRSARSSAARCSRARPTAFMAMGGPRARRRRDRGGLRRAASTASSPTSARDRRAGAGDRRADGRRGRARRRVAPRRRSRVRGTRCARPMRPSLTSDLHATVAILPVKRFDRAKQRLGAPAGRGLARGARRGDGARRARRARAGPRAGRRSWS